MTDEHEDDSKIGCNRKSSNGDDDSFSLFMVAESFDKDKTMDTQPNELHFTLQIYKEYKWRIYKPLFLIKFALLFWFGGAYGMQAFFALFLKQRGLSVANYSLITSISVAFQLISASSSAIIADKIGRAKPVLYAHFVFAVLASIAFVLIPPLTSDDSQFLLHNTNNDNNSRLIAEAWCNNSTTLNEYETCTLYYSTNTSHNSNEDHCFPISSKELSQTVFDDNSTNILETIKMCYIGSAELMLSGASHTMCNFTYCKLLDKECAANQNKCLNWDRNTVLLLTVYALLIILYNITQSCLFRCLDVTVISLTAERNADFGRQRVLAIFGSLAGPALFGYVLQTIYGSDANYCLAFIFYILFTIVSGLLSWNLKIRMRKRGQRMWIKVLELLKNPDILAFILILLVLGACFNFMVIYSNWYLEDLGASKLLLGMSMPLSNIAALFSLYFSKWWVRNLGEHTIFIMALVGYGFYHITLTFLIEPWYSVLIGNVVYCISYHILWVAVVEYCHTIAPEGLYATVIVIAGVLHFTVGKVLASLIGGMFMAAYGGKIAFRAMGSVALVTAVLYGCFRFFRRCKQQTL